LLLGLLAGHTRTLAVLDIGGAQPVGQTRLGDPKVFGDLRQRRFALTGDRDHIVPELAG
jgi:hypothetical protein